MLDDLFTYRLAERPLPDGHQRLQPRAATSPGSASTPPALDVEVRDAHADWAMLAVQGPRARAALAALADGELPARMRTAELELAGVPALVCGTGYTGEDGCELLVRARRRPPRSGTRCSSAACGPPGLGARDTLRLEVCFHLYGNDLSEDRNPIEAGLGWCCKLDTGFIGAEALAAVSPSQTLVPFAFTGPGIPRQGNPVERPARRRRGHQRQPVALPGDRHRDGLRAGRGRRAGYTDRGGRARQGAPRGGAGKAALRRGRKDQVAEASYPEDLKYHAEHDWARIEGDQATFGITWYAQDALGEVVFFDPPEVGTQVTKDQAYAEVESVKAVSDVFAPLSGEIVEVNEALADSPEKVNEDPYGEGWMVKVRLTDPSEVDALLDVNAYRDLL